MTRVMSVAAPLRTLKAAAVGLVLLASTLGAMPYAPSILAPARAGASATTDGQEREFADAINRERSARGLPQLRVSSGLQSVARSWSNQMAANGQISHNPNLASDVGRVSGSWLSAGENVGVGYTVDSIHSAFMNSEGHRANILGNWNYVGLGVTSSGGKIWVTEVFLRDSASLATTAAPAATPTPVSTAAWYLRNANSPGQPNLGFAYGMSDYQMLACDWNGDGVDSIAVYVGDTFYIRNSNAGGAPDMVIRYGWNGVRAVCGDWNGDGTDTIGVYSGDTFYLRNANSAGPADMAVRYGWSAATPVVGDWNGDRTDTVGVFAGGSWYLRNSNSGGAPDVAVAYGAAGYRPVVGDWNADGVETIGVYAGNTFYLRNANSGGAPNAAIPYGANGWTPVAGDWNADGAETIGVVQR